MKKSHILFAVAGVFLVVGSLSAETKPEAQAKPPDHGIFAPSEIKWVTGPPSLPPGAKMAMLEGDPAKEGPFTMRISMPDGFRIPPHWHSKIEHVTVISGTFNLGMGESFDLKSGREMPAGTFGFMPAGMRHFAFTKGETVVQVHGVGPWDINYINPADDPRKK